ncbi:nitroreductase [Orrella sp. NBD-18]|uniref:Nitroreductase n=1 Tax=Sheuella amnicola TaxID=2707330 RepID=A0A6B2R140_9BURK|nr:nitroreductase [Sheuella amnicola]NDY83962.1 nitroreductase [Sheuella amnicola]HBI83158.1 nitrobenzoate reductase [Alcaligenaceae bacterium]
MIQTKEQQIVDEAITSRHSMRAFLPTPVAREDIERMLEVAARAPSGSNTQPWKVYVLTGAIKTRLSDEILKVYSDKAKFESLTEEYRYYPDQWASPYIERRRKVGLDLYKLLGLGKDDKAGMQAQHGRNYVFFDAPVGLIFTMDRTMNTGSWLDFGCFLQNFMVAARGRGLDTCAQAAFNRFHPVIRSVTGIPESELVICGMALGYADHSRIENSLISEREPVSGFTRFLD